MLTPKEVSGKTFDKTFGFGYRMDDVDAYLQKVADSMTELMEINSDLEKKLEVLADKLNEYREDEESLRTAILGAQKLGDSVIRESKTKAEIITRDATCKAEAMVNNAKRQIEREQENLLRTQREVANFKNRLLDMYKSHIELISMIPGDVEEEDQPEEIEEVQPEEVITEQPLETVPESDDREITIEDIDVDEDELPKLTPPEQYFGIDLDDDDEDEEDEAETPSKHGEMRFGDAFRIKHKSTQHKFRK